MNYKHKYTNVFAARTKRAFLYCFSKRKKARDFVRFLRKLVARWPRTLLFIDKAPCHKGALVNNFLAAHRKTLRVEHFPSYTPELNPAEPCWKPGRKTLSNKLLRTIAAAKYQLSKVYDEPKNLPKMFSYL